MLIREWMSDDVITSTEETSMLKISRQMKEFSIRRVPIVDENNKVIGIISDRDIKDASPSKATSLDVHEVYYLLSEIKAKDIMTANPICVNQGNTIEQVALLMQEHRLTGLPVVDDEDHLVGMITEHDIFNVLVEITGVRKGGIQLALEVSDEPGSLRPILSLLRQEGGRITSILTGRQKQDGAAHDVFIRIRPLEKEAEQRLIQVIKEGCTLRYWVTETVHIEDEYKAK